MSVKTIEAIAKRLSDLLEEKKISQYLLCKKVAIDASNIYNIIYKRTKSITLNNLLLICDGLGITVQEFFSTPLFCRENLEID